MKAVLYVIPASHPCVAVARALEIKGIPFRTVELPPGFHAVHQKLRFGRRTVPALKMGRLTTSGSREIMRALDIVRPEPALLPADTERRSQVLEAEAWGETVLQAAARAILWTAVRSDPHTGASYLEEARLPVPRGVTAAMVPGVVALQRRLNRSSETQALGDLRALPGWLDKIDAWIGDGTLGGEQVNAADLQIGSSIRLLATLDDLVPMLDGRPATDLAYRLFPRWPGGMPAGSLPPG